MATATLTNSELRIITLGDAEFSGLEELFDEQCEEWLALLGWDYTGASRLIREVTRQRELTGVAAVMGGKVVGFAFYIVEGDRCSIGDIYVARRWRKLGADRQMVAAILDHLDQLPRLRRIESQCVGIGNEKASELFASRGFERFNRSYMVVNPCSRGESGLASGARLPNINIRAWEEADFDQGARIIHRSYRNEHDSRINSQYATEDGCAELLSIMTDHIWCGEFLPEVSRVAALGATGKRVGLLIGSRIAPGAGHIGQISILPAYQGLGLGRSMINAALAEFCRRGFKSVSLAVTGANLGAVHLYRSCGFRPVHEFSVFYREKR